MWNVWRKKSNFGKTRWYKLTISLDIDTTKSCNINNRFKAISKIDFRYTYDVFIRMTPTLYKRLVGMVAVNPLKDKNGEAINMFAFDMSPNVTLILVEPTDLMIVMPEN